MEKINYLLLAILFFLAISTGCKPAGPDEPDIDKETEIPPPVDEPDLSCIDGVADDLYPCRNVDLLAHVPLDSLKGNRANDVWGWTDPLTDKEYAIVGLSDGVTFVDISDPVHPEVIGKLVETHTAKSATAGLPSLQHEEEKSDWRDFKIYDDYLFVVSDNQPDKIQHGMQVFDLTRLRSMKAPVKEYTEDALYSEFHDAHNITVNEETYYAYAVGSKSHGEGLHMIDIQDPLHPKFAGYYADSTTGRHSTGYIHDAQCVVYKGPDEDYQGKEVCFSAAETHLLLVDVTKKDSAFTITKRDYGESKYNRYAHQGWLTEDHKYFLLDDEDDEKETNSHTRTYIWNVCDLDDPTVIGVYEADNGAIDHNQYIRGNHTYQANYTSGLHILNIDNIASGKLKEVAYFDTHPEDNKPEFDGAWSTYPFFKSGVLIVSDISRGLFILKPTL